jgi:ribosome-associated protein
MIIIKAQRFRSQDQNREDALLRLQNLIKNATRTPQKRLATKPSKASREKRIESKIRRGRLKASRGKVHYE